MFSRFYQGELAFLRAMGRAYAEANPSAAGLLADRGSDPDVERLLEGFAFLSARVRERIEDSIPEIVHDLTELLLPHYLRSIPAASILEFVPVPGALRARLRVPRETEVGSVPVEGTACRFRTTADLDLLPVTVQDVSLDQAIGANPALRVQLQTSAQALPALLQPEGLRFFIQGELPLASTLLLWIAEHLKEVEVRGATSRRAVTLPRGSVRAIGFDPAFSLLAWPRFAPAGYRNLQELFAIPQKFLFFEVRNLDAAADLAEEGMEIVLRTERPPELPARVTRDTLRVNCVPVVNLFRTTADPVRFETLGEEHLLRAAELSPAHMEIHSVDSAIGMPEGPGERRPYHAFTSFAHGTLGNDARYYRLRRALSPIDQGLDTWLSVSRPVDSGAVPGPEILASDVTATNRSLPAQLKLGEISRPTPASPTLARFRNVTQVTKPVRPPLASELHWRLVAHLAASRAPIDGPEILRELLELYNFQALLDQQAGRTNRLRIEGLRECATSGARRIVEGAPVRGTRVVLTLDEDHFAGPGDAWLFARAVDELLAAQVGINAFAETVAHLAPSQREYRFPARAGGKALL
jgi:type VI secretion system protein ImpG